MLFLRKIFIYLLSLGELFFLYLLIIKPEKNIYWLSILFILLIILTRLTTGKKTALKNFLSFLFFIIIFYSVGILFLAVIENIILSYLFIFFITILSLFYFRLLYSYVWEPENYQAFSLVNFISYLSFLIFYFFSTVCYVFVNVLNISIWLIALILALFFVIILVYNFFVENLNLKKYWRHVLVYFCLISEITWLIAWLPWSYFVKGFCLAVIAYFILYYFIKNLKHEWSKKNFFWQLIIVFILVMLILITTRWF